MSPGHDWLKVVYRPELRMEKGRSERPVASDGVVVRLTPPEVDLARMPGREHRHRVSVVPAAPGTAWRLFLQGADGEAGGEGIRGRLVWWKAEPGTWQPLTGSRALVAEGRGRTRLDVSLRLDGEEAGGPSLRFVAEPRD